MCSGRQVDKDQFLFDIPKQPGSSCFLLFFQDKTMPD